MNRTSIRWCNWEGKTPSVAAPNPCPHDVTHLGVKASVRDLKFRDPGHFVAGEVHSHLPEWEKILKDQPKGAEILGYLSKGVCIDDFLVPFKGSFQGQHYSSSTPPKAMFSNNKSCIGFEEFISSTISQRLRNGSLSLWGKAGCCNPPHLVMPITIEPTKPRMCHDERFLNLWIKDSPLKLDYISNLPRYVSKSSFQTTMDDKSGYDHVALSPESRTYFGIEWQGWYFVYHTIPFGWKASAYIYHTIGMGATSYIRSLGIPCSQYIDDRHLGQLTTPVEYAAATQKWSDFELAEGATFVAASVLIALGYFIGLAKSSLTPSRTVRFLGFIVDSERQAFILPEEKKAKFARLRESILEGRLTSVKTLQRLAGKVTSFSIAVPAAQLYTREIFKSISGHSNSSRPIKISGLLREEIEFWRFLDTWQECLHWPSERHTTIRICSDASDYAWGGVITVPGDSPVEIRDYWDDESRKLPIAIREALALLYTLQAGQNVIRNTRVDAHTDNMTFLQSWKKLGGKNRQLNNVLKRLYSATLENNVHLTLQYIPSCSNPADAPSRQTSDLDCTLSPEVWAKVEERFGPHTIDLMSLDSNTQQDASGQPLKHYTPFFTPLSSGVNVFAQAIQRNENPYVFPPFVLVGPLLKFLSKCEASFTIIVPKLYPLPYWWPILRSRCQSSLKLGNKGQSHILLFPSARGGFSHSRCLPWDLFAFRKH